MIAVASAGVMVGIVLTAATLRRPRSARRPARTDEHSATLVHDAPSVRRRRPSGRARRCAALVGAGVMGLAVGYAPTAAALIGVVGWHRGNAILRQRLSARQRAQALPDVLELFVLVVLAGLTPRQAVEELAHRAPVAVRSAFGTVVHHLERGHPLADALKTLAVDVGPTAAQFVDVIGTADRYGLPIAPALERLAADGRATQRRLDEAAARSLPVKLAFPLVVCTLPSFVLLAIVPAVLAALSSLGDTSW